MGQLVRYNSEKTCRYQWRLKDFAHDFELSPNQHELERKVLPDENVMALDAELASRWQHEQGPDGLTQLVTDSINAMIEVRMWLEYGDYLAIHCEQINQRDMRDLLWKTTERCDWQEVARRIKIGEDCLQYHSEHPESPVPDTPWINDVKTAADRKGLDAEQTMFEIKGYADRNAAGHIGIGRMIDECNWQALAERIEYDKATMNTVFANDHGKGVRMRLAVGKVAKAWFKRTGWDNGRVFCILNEHAVKKTKALERRKESKALNAQQAQNQDQQHQQQQPPLPPTPDETKRGQRNSPNGNDVYIVRELFK